MSSGSDRGHASGIIMQGKRVVGAVCIPDASDAFIEQFNNCYGPMKLQCNRIAAEVSPMAIGPGLSRNRAAHRMTKWFRQSWRSPGVAMTETGEP